MKKMNRIWVVLLLAGISFGMGSCMKEDIDDIRKELQEHDGRLASLEEWQKSVNTDITSLQRLIQALEDKNFITGVTPVMEGTEEVGYTITFQTGNPITIKHGEDGDPGVTPQIGAAKDTDNPSDETYYWTVKVGDGQSEFLTDGQGGKLPVTGEKGDTPVLSVGEENGKLYWKVDGTWLLNGPDKVPATGEQGDAIFKKDGIDYTSDPDNVILTLADGTTLTLPKYQELSIVFTGVTDYVYDTEVGPGQTYHIEYTITGEKAAEIIIVKADSEAAGLTVGVTPKTAVSGTIDITTSVGLPSSSIVTVLLSDGRGFVSMYAVTLKKKYGVTITGNDDEGVSHTLTWAEGNIVLGADGKLTFGSPNAAGLYFPWGSLIGIAGNSRGDVNFTTADIVFRPEEYTGTIVTWNDIPYINAQNPNYEDALMNYNGGTGFKAPEGNGDVCRYMTAKGMTPAGKWRMPTHAEYKALLNAGYVGYGSAFYETPKTTDRSAEQLDINANGNYVVDRGVFFGGTGFIPSDDLTAAPPQGVIFLPESGRRDWGGNGKLTNAYMEAAYWSGTIQGSNGIAYVLNFLGAHEYEMYPDNSHSCLYANTIRCVRYE